MSSQVGRVRRLINNSGKEPFGFISPECGGADIWFGKHLLGGNQTWEEFERVVHQYSPGQALVSYVVETGHGKPRAKGVLALEKGQTEQLDDDHDGHISAEELRAFLEARPEMRDANKTPQEIAYEIRAHERERRAKEHEEQKAAYEATSQKRGVLYNKLQAKENVMHEAIDAVYHERRDLKTTADQLWKDSNAAWSSGKRDEAKQMQADAKLLQSKREALMQKARSLEHDLKSLDWANNEEMFEFVQNDHTEKQDGTWLDLHGLEGDFAVHKTEEFLIDAVEKGIEQVEIITGRGNHSAKGKGPVLKRKVWTDSNSLLNRACAGDVAGLEGLQYNDDDGNDGDVTVVLPHSKRLKIATMPSPSHDSRMKPSWCA